MVENTVSKAKASIDERCEVIRHAIEKAKEFESNVTWRDVVPPEFIYPRSTLINSFQTGDDAISKQAIDLHEFASPVTAEVIGGNKVKEQHK